MATRIKLRRDSNADWTANNPTLSEGEIGIVTDAASDDVKLKIGDGTTVWNALSYFDPGNSGASWGSIAGTVSNQSDLQSELDLKFNISGGTITGSTTVLKSTAGVETDIIVKNLDNTNGASHAHVHMQVGGSGGTSSGGDPHLIWSVLTAQTYAMGIDNSVSGDPLKISANANLGTNDIFTLTQGGELTLVNNIITSGDLKLTDSGFSGIITPTTLGADRTYTLPNKSMTFAGTNDKLSAFAATTSAELAGVISDDTGSGALVFANSPTLVTPILGVASATSLNLLDSTYKDALSVLSANNMQIGSGFSNVVMATNFTFNGSRSITATAQSFTLTINPGGGSTAHNGLTIGRTGSITATTGDSKITTLTGTFAPTTGSGTFSAVDVINTINQTNGGVAPTGVISLINVRPTVSSVITSIYGVRSQLASGPIGGGTAWNFYADGTAPNYFNGKTSIGTTTVNATLQNGGSSAYKTTVSSSASLTLDLTATTWVFSGTSTTWTLPALSGNTDLIYFIKNRGSSTLTLQRAGSDQLYTSSAVTSLTINPGESYIVQNDGTYWNIM